MTKPRMAMLCLWAVLSFGILWVFIQPKRIVPDDSESRPRQGDNRGDVPIEATRAEANGQLEEREDKASANTRELTPAEQDSVAFIEKLPIHFGPMAQEQVERAIRTVEWENRSWNDLENGTAKFKTIFRRIENGVVVESSTQTKTGTLAFRVGPSKNYHAEFPVEVDVRISDEGQKLTYVGGDLMNPRRDVYCWAEKTSPENGVVQGERSAFDDAFVDLLFHPLSEFVAKGYQGGRYRNKNKETPKHDYFSLTGPGYPRRLSTETETNNMFKGNRHILIRPGFTEQSPYYWLDERSMEIGRIDVPLGAGAAMKSYRYEEYSHRAGENVKFPKRCAVSYLTGAGDRKQGWEYIVELDDVYLNVDLPPGTFEPVITASPAKRASF